MRIIERWEEEFTNGSIDEEDVLCEEYGQCRLGNLAGYKQGDCCYCSDRTKGGKRKVSTWICLKCKQYSDSSK